MTPTASVLLAVHGSFGALDHEIQEPGVICLADDKGIRLPRLSRAKRRQLIGESVENRMVLNFDIHLHLFGPLFEVLQRVNKLRHLARRPLSDKASANHTGHVQLAAVLHREDQT